MKLSQGYVGSPMENASDVCVIVPAFNEGPVIARVLAELVRLPYRIVVVDDGSSDNTAQQASNFPATVLRHVCNLGQGAALQTGISYALGLGETRFIVTFDSDGQHNVEDIPRLLEPLRNESCDAVLGSRFLRPESAVNIETRKWILLKLAVAFTRITTRLRVTDTHNGLRAFTADAAAKMRITQNRMAHASEILYQKGPDDIRQRQHHLGHDDGEVNKMTFQLSQLILIAAILLFLVYVFRVRTVVTDRIIYLVLVFGGILLAVFPDSSTGIANLIGVGRGADLLLYIFVIFSLFHHVNTVSRLRNNERKITAIVRKIAIADARNYVSPQGETISGEVPVVGENKTDGQLDNTQGSHHG
jgi:glycosyltransferase involved in cell wall biosynthesis